MKKILSGIVTAGAIFLGGVVALAEDAVTTDANTVQTTSVTQTEPTPPRIQEVRKEIRTETQKKADELRKEAEKKRLEIQKKASTTKEELRKKSQEIAVEMLKKRIEIMKNRWNILAESYGKFIERLNKALTEAEGKGVNVASARALVLAAQASRAALKAQKETSVTAIMTAIENAKTAKNLGEVRSTINKEEKMVKDKAHQAKKAIEAVTRELKKAIWGNRGSNATTTTSGVVATSTGTTN